MNPLGKTSKPLTNEARSGLDRVSNAWMVSVNKTIYKMQSKWTAEKVCTNLHVTRIALSFLSLDDSFFSRSIYVSLCEKKIVIQVDPRNIAKKFYIAHNSFKVQNINDTYYTNHTCNAHSRKHRNISQIVILYPESFYAQKHSNV